MPASLDGGLNSKMTPETLIEICDTKGFLANKHAWNDAVATCFAEMEGITLTDAHWEILHLLREFHETYDASPANRALVNFVKKRLGPDKGNSLYLMGLFPGSPARIGSRIAGLPKPKNCL